MRVGLDVAPLLQTQAGTARWVAGLRRGLEAHPDIDVVPLTWGGRGRLTAVARDLVWYPALLPRAAARAGADVLHCTIFRAPTRSRVPTIVTVHDLAVLRYPEVFPAWTRLYGRTALRPTIRGADRVFAVSEFSKREVVELADVDPDLIDVVPNALEPVFRPDGAAAEGDYVLAVGTLEPRKNLARVVEATALAGDGAAPRRRVRVGRGRRARRPRDLARPDRRRRARGRSTGAPAASSSPRSTRGSASPRSRRWRAGRRS